MTSSTRRSRASLKELLLDAAMEIVADEGIGVAASHITYKRVFAHLDETKGIHVTHGSVHERIWDGQEDFQLDVLRRAAFYEPGIDPTTTVDVAGRAFDGADTSTHDGREALLRKLTQLAGAANVADDELNSVWDRWVGVIGIYALSGLPPAQIDQLAETLGDSYRAGLDTYGEIYEGIREVVGYEPTADIFGPPTTESRELVVRLFTILSTALIDGLLLRRRFDPGPTSEFTLSTGPNGEDETWNALAFGAWALLQTLFEDPRGDGVPPI